MCNRNALTRELKICQIACPVSRNHLDPKPSSKLIIYIYIYICQLLPGDTGGHSSSEQRLAGQRLYSSFLGKVGAELNMYMNTYIYIYVYTYYLNKWERRLRKWSDRHAVAQEVSQWARVDGTNGCVAVYAVRLLSLNMNILLIRDSAWSPREVDRQPLFQITMWWWRAVLAVKGA